MARENAVRRLTAILSADVVGYSRLMGIDEAGTLGALRAHRAELIDSTTVELNGRIVKLMEPIPEETPAAYCKHLFQRLAAVSAS